MGSDRGSACTGFRIGCPENWVNSQLGVAHRPSFHKVDLGDQELTKGTGLSVSAGREILFKGFHQSQGCSKVGQGI